MPLHIGAIDDDRAILYTLEAMASTEGWRMLTTNVPEECLDWVKLDEVDILLVDYHMPVMNGLDFLSIVRGLSSPLRFMPVVMLTGHSDELRLTAARDRGVNDLSTALKRRFNFVQIPIVTNKKSEREIVLFRTRELLARNRFEVELPPALLEILLQTFADLREVAANETNEENRLESSLSTAEQIGVLEDAVLHGQFFGTSGTSPQSLARSLVGTLVRRIPEDVSILNKFWHSVVDKRAKAGEAGWKEFEAAGKEALEQCSTR